MEPIRGQTPVAWLKTAFFEFGAAVAWFFTMKPTANSEPGPDAMGAAVVMRWAKDGAEAGGRRGRLHGVWMLCLRLSVQYLRSC